MTVGGYAHFVVFRGAWNDRVLLADPGFGNRSMRVERFEAAWTDHLALAVTRGGDDGDAVPPNRLAPEPRDFALPLAAAVRTAVMP
jgi:predicted double-glycine peptidase